MKFAVYGEDSTCINGKGKKLIKAKQCCYCCCENYTITTTVPVLSVSLDRSQCQLPCKSDDWSISLPHSLSNPSTWNKSPIRHFRLTFPPLWWHNVLDTMFSPLCYSAALMGLLAAVLLGCITGQASAKIIIEPNPNANIGMMTTESKYFNCKGTSGGESKFWEKWLIK